MMKSWPLVFLSFAGGICLAYNKSWLLLLLAVILMLLAAGFYQDCRPHILFIITIIAGGMVYYSLFAPQLPTELASQNAAQLIGKVHDIPYYDGENTRFTLQVESSSPYRKKIRVVCLFQSHFNRGDVVKLQGNLKTPPKPGNPGEFDYPAYLARQGIYYNLTVKKAAQASLISPAEGPLQWVDSFRQRAERLTREVLSPREASILLGMLMGGRAGMEDEQYDDFQKTGIVHLFSVGGLHVGFILVLINWLCSLARFSIRGKFLTGVFVLLIYGTMVAWPPPVIRAVLMGILGLLAYLSGRENSLLNALAISGLVILLINPASLFDLSFQLTILATAGLVYLFPLFREKLPYKGLGWDMLLIPICTELAVLPLVAYHFNLFTPISILTNILITYLSGGVVILGFIAFLLSSVLPSLATLFLYPVGMFIEMILFVVQWMKMVPGAYVWVATPAVGMIILYYAALGLAARSLQITAQRKFFIPAVALLLTFIITLLLPPSCYNRGDLEVVFIDVGQGDAMLLKTPQGKFILVDGGGSQFYDVGARKLLPYLHHRGLRHIDMLISTHPDIDHIKGLESVAEQIPVKCLGLPASIAACKEYQNLKGIAARENISVIALGVGQIINLEDGLIIKVLHPQWEAYNGDNFNQESVVLQVSYQRFSALLTGDITAPIMPLILEKVKPPFVIVKVPHHGSKGSLYPDFYKSLQPRYAVISVAADNPFGHPHGSVLETLTEEGVKVMRTDRDGAVIVRSNGENFRISTTITGSKTEPQMGY
ncbi:MAG: DNA internalization-related competence protein ComEC/Rec2 [Syntrophomonas sp.]|nr:DNA internalization-related competence protein ComEC/Rec2 [Syntrophomonas sp.]